MDDPNDAVGFEEDYEDEAEDDKTLFKMADVEKKKKKKNVDELDEIYEQGQGSDEDIYATEEFDSFEGAKDED